MMFGPILLALGFLLASFYNRTTKKTDELPTTYVTIKACDKMRGECRVGRSERQDDMKMRLDRFEGKLDKIEDMLIKVITHNGS